VKSTNNDAPTVKFLLCYTGDGCGQGGNGDEGCCRVYKTVNPLSLIL
jgi:hypothetical protein